MEFKEICYTLALSPILLPQALYVKKKTLELPEAEGERAGLSGQGEMCRLVVIGDSAAAGVGVKTQSDALGGQLSRLLSTKYSVQWRVVAQSGLNTNDFLSRLEQEPSDQVDLVVSSLGVNDVTSSISRKEFSVLQGRLVETIKERFKPKLILLTSVPPMHLFPALPQPLRWFLGRRALMLNKCLTDICQLHQGVELLQLALPIDEQFFADDGFHPNEKAYQLWAQAVVDQFD